MSIAGVLLGLSLGILADKPSHPLEESTMDSAIMEQSLDDEGGRVDTYHYVVIDPNASPNDKNIQISSSYVRCIRRAKAVDPLVWECQGAEMAYQDRRLNSNYRKLMAELDERARQALRLEEREWIKERDILCKWEDDSGTRGRLEANSCTINHVGLRATYLAEQLSAIGGR